MTSNSKKNSRRVTTSDGFLENLRRTGNGPIKTSKELKPNQTINLKETTKYEKFAQDFQKDFLDLRRQERLIFTQAEQKSRLEIKTVQEELKKLASSTKNLAKQVEMATFQAPIEPGIYHLSFFEKLRQTIILFRKSIEESATWLAAFNQRGKKRNYYWRQFKKSGTKFLLSSERYMATQAG